MRVYEGSRFGRYFIIGLQKDDLILESIKKTAEQYGIRNAIITSGIAATYHMRWHHIKNTEEHLEEGCRIQYVGEISMIELLDLDLSRIPNEFGVKLISEKTVS